MGVVLAATGGGSGGGRPQDYMPINLAGTLLMFGAFTLYQVGTRWGGELVMKCYSCSDCGICICRLRGLFRVCCSI
jgi:hypothetical protein